MIIKLIPGLLMLGLAVSSHATPPTVECGVERQVSIGMLSETTFNRLSRVHEDIGEERYSEAYSTLQGLLERVRRSEFEQSNVLHAMAFVAMNQEDWSRAIEHMREIIRLDKMPNNQHYDLVRQIAQLYNMQERYRDALAWVDHWFCIVPEEERRGLEDMYVLRASIHFHLDEYRQALQAIDQAIALTDEPRVPWYQLKLGLHFELEEFREAIEVLKILVQLRPGDKAYWVQMSSLYMQLDQESDAMAVLGVAWRKGLLDRQSEFLQLASLLQAHEAPRKAAEVLEDGIERGIIEQNMRHWEMVGGAWYEAREMNNALNAYERAGSVAVDGRIDLQRAHILVNQEDWEGVRNAVARALDKGGLSESQAGNAQMLLGMAHFHLNSPDEAIRAFNQAANYGRLERAAREWINHVREGRS